MRKEYTEEWTYAESLKKTFFTVMTRAPIVVADDIVDIFKGVGVIILTILNIILVTTFFVVSPPLIPVIAYLEMRSRVKANDRLNKKRKEALARDNKLCFKVNKNGQ